MLYSIYKLSRNEQPVVILMQQRILNNPPKHDTAIFDKDVNKRVFRRNIWKFFFFFFLIISGVLI